MKYMLVSMQFLSLSLGIASLAVSIILYLKYRYRSVKYYILFLSVFTIRVLLNNILFTIRMDNTVLYYYLLISYQIIADISLLLLFVIPFQLHHFLSIPKEKLMNTILLFIFLLTAGSEFYPYLLSGKWARPENHLSLINNVPGISLLFMSIYLPVLVLQNFKKLKPALETRGMVILSLSFFYIFVIFDFLVSKKSYLFNMNNDWFYILTHLIFYFCWNLFFLIFTIRYFHALAGPVLVEPDTFFFNKYNITEREQEIVRLILSGYNNGKIAEKFFISPKTVKNHVHNIYQKTGVNNRMELSFLIRQNKAADQ